MTVQISVHMKHSLQTHESSSEFEFLNRGLINLKGKGEMEVFELKLTIPIDEFVDEPHSREPDEILIDAAVDSDNDLLALIDEETTDKEVVDDRDRSISESRCSSELKGFIL